MVFTSEVNEASLMSRRWFPLGVSRRSAIAPTFCA